MLVLLLLFRLILLASISVYFLLQFQLILCISFSLFFCLNFCKDNVNPRDYKMFWLFFVCSCSLCFSFLFFTVSPSFFRLYLPNPFLSLSSQHISVFISSPSPSLFLLSFLSFFFLLSLLSYFTPVSVFSFLFFPQSSLAIYINRCTFFLFRIDVSGFCKVNMANYRWMVWILISLT